MAGKIEVRHLRLIQAVAREGSLTRAGARLHLSQSALSHQLLGLEKDLGAKLFDRIGKRMVPTEAGLRLLELADTTLRALDEAEASLQQQRREERPRLRVAPSCYTMYPWLAAGMARFAADWPELDLQIVPEVGRCDVGLLVADEVDLLIAHHPSGDARFESKRLFAMEILALLNPTHRLVTSRTPRRPAIGWRELAGETLLTHDMREGDERQLRDATAANSGPPTRIWFVQMTEAIAELARAGHGIGIIAEQILPSPLGGEGLVTMPLWPREERVAWAVWLKSKADRLPLAQLAGHLETLRQQSAPPVLSVVGGTARR
jgi:LysR family transcriptional regulator, regulator for metE and metH